MFGFADLAEHYKPTPEVERPNPHADEDKFPQYAELAVDCTKALAPYQSPTFRAVVVAPWNLSAYAFTLNIFDHDGRELPPPEEPSCPLPRHALPEARGARFLPESRRLLRHPRRPRQQRGAHRA